MCQKNSFHFLFIEENVLTNKNKYSINHNKKILNFRKCTLAIQKHLQFFRKFCKKYF